MPSENQARPYQLKTFKYNSHYWVLEFIEAARRPLRILDVGTADGYLGALLKQRGHYLVGLEQDVAQGQSAQEHYDSFQCVDIEAFEFPYRGQFDVVLFADVLEHLRDPAATLKRSLKCLDNGGQVIVSVPNVAHLIVRLMLLCGRFDYSDRGILDRTHLRFYTLASLRGLMHEASCRLLEVVPTPVPVQLILPWTDTPTLAWFHELHFLAARLWKTLLAYQFVIRAAPQQG